MYIKMNDDKSLIITVPSTIYRGENNSGMITFLVPAQYQGKNLTEYSFWMRYTLPSNVGDSEPLSIESEIHKGYLKLSTIINTRISKEEGPVTVWLTATDSSDYVVFKSGELRININPSQDISDCLEQEDVDQLDLIDIEVDKLQDAVEDLEERIGQSAEGISPIITLNETDDGVLLAITDKDGTKTATIRHGQDGKQGPVGETGATGASGKDGQNGKDGRDGVDGAPGPAGKDGKDGKDGYTPVKGVDYFDGEDGRDGVDGKSGVYVGSGDMPDDCNVQIDPEGIVCDMDDIVSSVVPALPNTPPNVPSIELIETITLEEDTSSIVREVMPDGTPYAFKSVFALIAQNQTWSNKWIKMTTHYDASLHGVNPYVNWWAIKELSVFKTFSMSGPNGIGVHIGMLDTDGIITSFFSYGGTNPGYLNNSSASIASSIAYNVKKAKIIKVALDSETPLVSGTTIRLYGVRA